MKPIVTLALNQGKSWLKPVILHLHVSAMNGGVKAMLDISLRSPDMLETRITKMKIPIQLNSLTVNL
ncbi:MAG: hypothetical protein HYV59_05255 [Planctomycetes bacterium]|nr:hypothetical protein [Planctomycetota bacterium]